MNLSKFEYKTREMQKKMRWFDAGYALGVLTGILAAVLTMGILVTLLLGWFGGVF